jgi:hypothetical protein
MAPAGTKDDVINDLHGELLILISLLYWESKFNMEQNEG